MTIYTYYNLANENFWIKTRDVALVSPNKARALGVVVPLAFLAASPIVLPLATLELLLRTIGKSGIYLISRSEVNLHNLKFAYYQLSQAFKETIFLPLTFLKAIEMPIIFLQNPKMIAASQAIDCEVNRFSRMRRLTPFMREMLVYQYHHCQMQIMTLGYTSFFAVGEDESVKFDKKFQSFQQDEDLYNEIVKGDRARFENEYELSKLKVCFFKPEYTHDEICNRYQDTLFPVAIAQADREYEAFLKDYGDQLTPFQKEIFAGQLHHFCSKYDSMYRTFFRRVENDQDRLEDLNWRERNHTDLKHLDNSNKNILILLLCDRNTSEEQVRDHFADFLPGASLAESKFNG